MRQLRDPGPDVPCGNLPVTNAVTVTKCSRLATTFSLYALLARAYTGKVELSYAMIDTVTAFVTGSDTKQCCATIIRHLVTENFTTRLHRL